MINIEKVNDILSYFAENVPDLTVTKTMKLFYYVDFVSFAEKGKPVSNDVYYKLPYGPVPSFIKNEVSLIILRSNSASPEVDSQLSETDSQLSENFIAEQKKIGKYNGFVIIKKGRKTSLVHLSKYETDLVKRVADKFGSCTAKQLTAATHKEKPYIYTSENSIIDYNLSKYLNVKAI